MIKPPCGHHCPNCGTVHTRCEKYIEFRKAKDEESAMIKAKKSHEYDAIKFKLDSIAQTTGKNTIYQR